MRSLAKVMEYRMSRWLQIMQDRDTSGMTVKAYCEVTGIKEHCYYYWQRKLRDAAFNQIMEHESVPHRSEIQPSRFAEIQLVADEPSWSAAVPSEPLGEIKLTVGTVVITANKAYPVAQLAKLIKGLAEDAEA